MPTTSNGNGNLAFGAYHDVHGNQDNRVTNITNIVQRDLHNINPDNIDILDFLSRASVKEAAWDYNLDDHEVNRPTEGFTMDIAFQDMQRWIKQPGKDCVYWLNGASGTGKTFLMRALSKVLRAEGTLGASFFFSGDDPSALFPTIAYRLHLAWPSLAKVTKESLKKDFSIPQSLADQLQKLIVTPVTQSKSLPQKVVVIDGLDQCSDDAADKISALLVAYGMKDPNRSILWVVSGHNTLDKFESADVAGFDVSRLDPALDIYDFLQNRLDQGKLRGFADWPPKPQEMEQLCSLSGSLFAYAECLATFIEAKNRNPRHRLTLVLSGDQDQYYPPERFDAIHKRALSRVPFDEYERSVRDVVGLVVHAARPLSLGTIDALLQMGPGGAWISLEGLRSIFSLPKRSEGAEKEPVYLVHTLFRQFIADPERSTIHYINSAQQNTQITRYCFKILAQHLRHDACDFQDFRRQRENTGTLEEDPVPFVSDTLDYAVRFWATHLAKAQIISDTDPLVSDLGTFVKNHVLFWVETLSILGDSDAILPSLRDAATAVKGVLPSLAKRISEIETILSKNIEEIGEYPLSIYPLWQSAGIGLDASIPQPPEASIGVGDINVSEALAQASVKGVSWDSDLRQDWDVGIVPTDQLKVIQKWIQFDQPQEKRIYWLHGPSGVGKSTLLRSLCKVLEEEKVLGASYFFSNSQASYSPSPSEAASLPPDSFPFPSSSNPGKSPVGNLKKSPGRSPSDMYESFARKTQILFSPNNQSTFAERTQILFSRRRRQSSFSSRSLPTLENSTLFTSIASQLHSARPLMAQRTEELLRQDIDLPRNTLYEQLQKLIIEPLLHLKNKRTVVVIDALERCGNNDSMEELAKMLVMAAERWSYLPILWVVSSHFELGIRNAFENVPTVTICNLLKFDATPDIQTYFSQTLQELSIKHEISGWPEPDQLKQLTARSHGLFMYARNLTKFIEAPDSTPQEQLAVILAGSAQARLDLEFDGLYGWVLSGIDYSEDVRNAIGLIVLAQETMLFTAVTKLLKIKRQESLTILNGLHALFSVEPSFDDREPVPVKLVHPLFRDYITSQERSGIFHINPVAHHAYLTHRCLRIMVKQLKRGVHDVAKEEDATTTEEEGASEVAGRWKERIHPATQYAMRHWSKHLTQAEATPGCELLTDLDEFVDKHLLFWVEGLSFLGEVEVISPCLQDAATWVQEISPGRSTWLTETAALMQASLADIRASATFVHTLTLPAVRATKLIFRSRFVSKTKNLTRKMGS